MNQKIVTMSAVILFLFVLVLGANAQTATNQINFGGPSQEASNPEDDDGPKLVTTTSTFSIPSLSSNLSSIITVINIQVEPGFVLASGSFSNVASLESQLGNTPGLFLIEVDSSNNQINTFGTTTDSSVTLKVIVPASLNAVDTNLEEKAFKVATVTLQLTNGSIAIPGTFDVFVQRESNLEIQDSNAEINGKERQSIDDGDSIDNLKPGDSIDMEVEVENNFNEDSNLKIRNVNLDLDCEGTDIDIDDESVDLGDITEDDSETESIKFDVEEDAEDGTNNCVLSTDGTDPNGARHGQKIEFDVEINRKNHDIQIKSVDISPSTLTCDDSSMQLSVSLLNLGTSDEDEVALEVSSKTLGIQQRIVSNLELDEDDSDVEVATIAVDPKKLKSGTYAIQLQSFYDNVKASDSEIVQVENTCDLISSQEPQPTQPRPQQPVVDALTLEQETVRFSAGGTGSVPVQVTNKETSPVEYSISLDNFEEFAESASTKSVFLNPGQSSTLFLNLKTKKDATEGKYTATVKLMKGNQVVETKSFTADVAGKASKTGSKISLGGEGTSRVFWIIGDIILIIIAVFFIRLIFTTGKKKEKKMADYEAEGEFKKNF